VEHLTESDLPDDDGDWEERLDRALAGDGALSPRRAGRRAARGRGSARSHSRAPSGNSESTTTAPASEPSGSTRPTHAATGDPGNGRGADDARHSGVHRPSWRTHRRYVRARKQQRRQVRSQRRTWWGRHPVASGTLVVLVLLTPIWVSFGGALANPSLGSSASARLAEWSRDHGAGGLVTWIENLYYSHHAPPIGGQPSKTALPGHSTGTRPTGSAVSDRVLKGALAVPAPLVPFPRTPLPGEGKWVPAGRLVDGMAAVYTTFMRPDAVHTSVVDGVAWIDTKLLSARLYSGSYIPGGGPYKYNTPLPLDAESSLVAAFNGGFRLADSQAGYYTEGVTVRPLVGGAASLVIYKNGTATVGAWGTELTMTPNVVVVRQELRLLVDNGQPAPGLATNEKAQWGTVLGNSIYVSRSAVGVTSDGALVYVGGPDLDAVDLARLLVRAGAVRAMELDINSEWVNFATFDPATPHGVATIANARDLLPSTDMSGAYRYFMSYWERDFFTLSARPRPLGTGS